MNLGDMINSFRSRYGEQSTRRFNNSILTGYANDAQIQLAYEVDHPEGTLTIPCVDNQQEYQLPQLMKILRAYVIGPGNFKQELRGTDIFTLEGDILHQYDNTSGVIVNQPNQSSQFFAQPPAAYPVQNVGFSGRGSGPIPTNSAWSLNSRPAYYERGGYIGIVPAPISSTYSIVVDFIPAPPVLNLLTDLSLFPDLFKDAIVWKMISYARYSDNQSNYKDAEFMYQDQMANKIRPWLDRQQATKPKTFVPRTVRSMFRGGWRR
jgi:hypothetical protein